MRQLAILLCFGFSVVCAHAQVKLKDSNSFFYNHLVWTGTAKLMTSEILLEAPVEKLPIGFIDTLKKYNWYDLCTYSFYEKTLSSGFLGLDTMKPDASSRQFNYFDVSTTGVVNRNYLLKTTNDAFAFYTLTFDTATATHVKSVSEIKGSTYLVQENYGELEYLKIISYFDEVMILETTRYGKAGEKPVMFRTAYLAMPKQ